MTRDQTQSPSWQADSLPSEPPGKLKIMNTYLYFLRCDQVFVCIDLNKVGKLRQVQMTRNGVYLETAKELQFGKHKASPVAQTVKNLPAVQETHVRPLGWEDPLEKGMVIHASILAWGESYGQSPWGHKESDTAECAKLQMSSLGQVLFMGKSENGQSLA